MEDDHVSSLIDVGEENNFTVVEKKEVPGDDGNTVSSTSGMPGEEPEEDRYLARLTDEASDKLIDFDDITSSNASSVPEFQQEQEPIVQPDWGPYSNINNSTIGVHESQSSEADVEDVLKEFAPASTTTDTFDPSPIESPPIDSPPIDSPPIDKPFTTASEPAPKAPSHDIVGDSKCCSSWFSKVDPRSGVERLEEKSDKDTSVVSSTKNSHDEQSSLIATAAGMVVFVPSSIKSRDPELPKVITTSEVGQPLSPVPPGPNAEKSSIAVPGLPSASPKTSVVETRPVPSAPIRFSVIASHAVPSAPTPVEETPIVKTSCENKVLTCVQVVNGQCSFGPENSPTSNYAASAPNVPPRNLPDVIANNAINLERSKLAGVLAEVTSEIRKNIPSASPPRCPVITSVFSPIEVIPIHSTRTVSLEDVEPVLIREEGESEELMGERGEVVREREQVVGDSPDVVAAAFAEAVNDVIVTNEQELVVKPVRKLPFHAFLDLIYWRDVKKTGAVFGSMVFVLLSVTFCSLLSVVSYLSLGALAITLSYRGYKSVLQAVQKTDDQHPFREYLTMDLAFSTDTLEKAVAILEKHLNNTVKELLRLFLVEDIVDSLKFFLLLWVFTYVGAWFNGLTLVILAAVAAFSIPKVYEMYQGPIDSYVDLGRSQVCKVLSQVQDKVPFLKKKAKTQ